MKMRPDVDHPQSKGFACPKGILFPEVMNDPDRLRDPMKRQPDGMFAKVGWDEALDDIGRRLQAIIEEHGRESVGCGLGNANAWNYGAFLTLFGMATALKTKHFYTASSVDINGYWVVSQLLYGNNLTNPFPDFARTDFALVIGANPVVSHGSMATIGRIRETMLGITERGGRVVVVDPRRTETARLFEHQPILPEGDVWLLLGLLHTIVDEDLYDRARMDAQASGVDFALRLARDVDMDRVAAETGIDADDVRQLARDFATARSANLYGRCGASLGRFATLTKYLMDVINIATGNLTETNKHADYVLPPKLFYEREGFPVFTQSHNSVPHAQWTDPVVTGPPNVRDDWKTLDEICKRIGLVPSGAPGAQVMGKLGIRVPPGLGVDPVMRIGPDGDLFGLRRRGISRKKLIEAGGPIKFSDHCPTGVIRKKIHHKDKLVHLEHHMFVREIDRLKATQTADAEDRGLEDGAESRWGAIEVPVEVTDEVVAGSVGLNQHWGHKGGWRRANAAGGARYNDLVPNDPALLDKVSGNAWVNGIGVQVQRAAPKPAGAETEVEVVLTAGSRNRVSAD